MVSLGAMYWSFFTNARNSVCAWIHNSVVHHSPNDYPKWVVGLN